MDTDSGITIVDGRGTIDAGTRDRAFELWDTVALHKYSEVASLTGINEATLRSWGRRDNWQARSLERHLDVAPAELRHATGSLLQAGAFECSRYMLNVAAGKLEPNRAKTQLCQAVLDRAGWAPTHYLPMSKQKQTPRRDLPNLDAMTEEELLQLERELTTGS